MKINKKIANGIVISSDDFEYVIAVRKPNMDVKIIREFWFNGNVRGSEKVLKEKTRKFLYSPNINKFTEVKKHGRRNTRNTGNY